MQIFVGALLAAQGLPAAYRRFCQTFGALIDAATISYDTYQSASTSGTSEARKRRLADGEESGTKHVKIRHGAEYEFRLSKDMLRELAGTAPPSPLFSASSRSSSPQATNVDSTSVEFASLFPLPADDIIYLSPNRFSTLANSLTLAQILEDIGADVQQEIQDFKRNARGKTLLSIPLALYEGFTFSANNQTRCRPSPLQPALVAAAYGRRLRLVRALYYPAHLLLLLLPLPTTQVPWEQGDLVDPQAAPAHKLYSHKVPCLSRRKRPQPPTISQSVGSTLGVSTSAITLDYIRAQSDFTRPLPHRM
ncbi:hypothetical protein B0H17DRAFT_1195037 [Mycena rosella]|uniref:Uncharacterized protein n=1 Tax=Mycena rosella TaxID=1033263 RepID=A0AAD7GMM5_MYCRO|nr:hypothetical protein B0H17DRAFT_1195037 [Mycena rosella]